MTSKPRFATLGSVSEGTLREGDLIATFSWELRYYMKQLRLTLNQRKRFSQLLRDCDKCDFVDHDEESNDFIANCICDLQDALNELAPPFAYFGAHEGDGACFGFWPITDAEEIACYSNFGEAVDNARASKEGHEFYVINDHGNVDCGYVNSRGRVTIYWGIV